VGVGPFFPGLQDLDFLSSGIQDPGIPNSDFGKSELHFFKFRKSGFQVFKFWFLSSDPLLSPPFFYMPTPETLEFKNTDTHTNTNKNMTFELLKVCRPANLA